MIVVLKLDDNSQFSSSSPPPPPTSTISSSSSSHQPIKINMMNIHSFNRTESIDWLIDRTEKKHWENKRKLKEKKMKKKENLSNIYQPTKKNKQLNTHIQHICVFLGEGEGEKKGQFFFCFFIFIVVDWLLLLLVVVVNIVDRLIWRQIFVSTVKRKKTIQWWREREKKTNHHWRRNEMPNTLYNWFGWLVWFGWLK